MKEDKELYKELYKKMVEETLDSNEFKEKTSIEQFVFLGASQIAIQLAEFSQQFRIFLKKKNMEEANTEIKELSLAAREIQQHIHEKMDEMIPSVKKIVKDVDPLVVLLGMHEGYRHTLIQIGVNILRQHLALLGIKIEVQSGDKDNPPPPSEVVQPKKTVH